MSGRKVKQERRVETVLPFREIDLTIVRQRMDNRTVLAVFQSSQFLACIYQDSNGYKRLSINRIGQKSDGSGRYEDGITWDTLQAIKSKIGLGSVWAVEVYPADAEVVNVSNMRHLFLLPEPPPFAWRTGVSS